ncbi:MAG: HDIG domain-containing protein [Chloroflexi bacterium]|nr:HDIG domain-containing protein [Chloroflexota bacterium]
MDRDTAWKILNEFVKGDTLLKHCLAVEVAMRGYARRFGEDEERWVVTGLLHDFEHEMHPTADKHPAAGAPLLRERGVPEDIIRAILSHAEYLGLERRSLMEKTLYAVDELASFVVAVALVRPSKSIREVEVSSVKKKMKDKAFARAVRRDEIMAGAEQLGVPLDEHIATVIAALQERAAELGIAG